jgi:hypothetical protein
MDLLYPCKTCTHAYEDHLMGLNCAICWSDIGFASHGYLFPNTCRKFIGDNLKYLEDKHNEK